MASALYSKHRVTFYCGCRFNKHKQINWKSCGYSPRKNKKRASRIEWEHIVPAAAFGNMRQCWRQPICKKKNGKTYGIMISRKQKQLYSVWDKQYPETNWENQRREMIDRITG